jgi:hypothetical protein
MAADCTDVNLVLDPEDDQVARSEQRLSMLGIAAAWVCASMSRQADPDANDERLARLCNGSPVLQPVPVLLPPAGAPGALGRARCITERADRRVVRICPSGHDYPLASWVLSPLPELLARADFALLLDFEPTPIRWQEAVPFAREYPSLPIVILAVNPHANRTLPAALDAAPNLLAQLAGSGAPHELGRLVRTFGTSRFVFGSGGSDDGARDLLRALDLQLSSEEGRAIKEHNARELADGSYAGRHL